ncbi:hypothetical protein Tsubulata_002332 [Turnera subulata]|uniref:Small-subunit processome Utp12 domain-containing protein n=1 Tax=Turnera subulata TaxID=218843 RepID=A0A9Q0JJ13_9ROSI|nr:hypothetical protein Tsubulata_002332 [Turnera subulata]
MGASRGSKSSREEMVGSTKIIKTKKKRPASEVDIARKKDVPDAAELFIANFFFDEQSVTLHGTGVCIVNREAVDGELVEYDLNEPTMGEKLESLNLQDDDKNKIHEEIESAPDAKPPSADSVNILLKQALHADDCSLLLDCLYNQDEKVIANSVTLLSPSDVLKLLHSLVSLIQSRGAILACVLPWLRCLLLQHATGIVAHESSLNALNSVYQLIEARVSTFQPALQLSSLMDILYAGIIDDSPEESERIVPVIYEDSDESDEEESEEAMDTDQNTGEEAFGGVGDFEDDDNMSD